MRIETMQLDKKKIKNLKKELENKLWNEGFYRKFSGSWDINIELMDDDTEEYLEEMGEGDKPKLIFKVTETCVEEDGGSNRWWYIEVEIDKEYNVVEIKEH